jgi:hypothetical protein
MVTARRALAVLALCACGPSAEDYPFLRPQAGPPVEGAGGEGGAEPTNVIEDDPLEPWDTRGAGPLSGVFAVELAGKAKVVVEVEFRILYRFRFLQRDALVRMRMQPCRLRMPSVEGLAELTVPIALELVMRKKVIDVEGRYLSSPRPLGATLSPPELLVVLGADLADPLADPLPTAADPTGAVDEDADGEAGVTLRAKTVLCDAEERVFVVLRARNLLTGTVESVDRITGGAQPGLDFSVLGYSHRCLAASADLPIEIVPGSTFRALRTTPPLDLDGNGNVVCGEIVEAAPSLFGDFWIP